jgi:UDP-glucose 4-epimerase
MTKHLEEQMAITFCRWDPALSITAMRFSNVMVEADYAGFEAWQDDPTLRKWNAWGYIDARDAAEAIRLALEVRGPGFERYVIANADTVMRTPSAELAAAVFPGVPFTRPVDGNETLLSIDKARRELGWSPSRSWRDTQG